MTLSPETSAAGMVERVAMAIRGTWQKNVPTDEICRLAACAAIDAMREPTERMLCSYPSTDPTGPFATRRDIYRAMIDAALAEDTSERRIRPSG